MCVALAPAGEPVAEDMLRAPLAPDTHQRILESEWYKEEVELYHFALDLHRRQVKYARANRPTPTPSPSPSPSRSPLPSLPPNARARRQRG